MRRYKAHITGWSSRAGSEFLETYTICIHSEKTTPTSLARDI